MLQSYFLLSDLNQNVRVKICSLKGKRFEDDFTIQTLDGYSDITMSNDTEAYVTCYITSNGSQVSLPSSTTYRCFPNEIKWNEWLQFSVKYRDLSPTSRLVFTVWEIKYIPGDDEKGIAASQKAVPTGGTSLPLFNKKGILKLGGRKLFLWRGVEGDGSIDSTTPYKTSPTDMDNLEKTIRQYDQKELPQIPWLDKLAVRRIERMQQLHDSKDDLNIARVPSHEDNLFLNIEFPAFQHPVVYHQKSCNPSLPEILSYKQDRLFVLHDPEMTQDNPVEKKYHKLAISSKGLNDRDLRPKIVERKEIKRILDDPDGKLTGPAKRLLWQYRFSLTENGRALTKFLRCVDWEDANDTEQAISLLDEWSPPDISDALELLSAFFTNTNVRSYAVKQLEERASNDDLSNFLLQLVQALRYESAYPSALSEFLIRRCTTDFNLTNFLHWFLSVERFDKLKGPMFSRLHCDFFEVLQRDNPAWVKILEDESNLIATLINIGERAHASSGRIKAKIERMRELTTKGELKHLREFKKPIIMAVRPEIKVTGIRGEKSTMFKSNLAPLLVHFTTTNPAEPYKVIFKSGDDLRQDQLIIQMINLMDKLLKDVNLDLKLTPYRVLATSPDDGFVEYVPKSHTLTSILEDYDKDIRKFFHTHNPKPNALQTVLNTFVRSCAGYCVITFILGIGDRHLDNVMLTESGHLFHIDFGYIFGKDPKPFPPPMKFCKEMVEAMGGSNSRYYKDFRKYCCLAFNILRKHASLILNLLSLMGDANIPDLGDDVDKHLHKVQEKFRLDLSDEESERYILDLVDESVSALFPQFVEKIHKWALYWK